MKVALYGDSYVDDKAILDSSTHTWISQLSSDYGTLFNYGLCGVGPDYCLDKLRKHGGNLIIFFTGFPDRLIFPDIPHPGYSVDISNAFYRKSLSLSHTKPDIREYLTRHSSSISYLYRSVKSSLLHRTEEILSYLSYYATMNECRVIAILSQNPFYSHNYLRKTYIPPYVSHKLNTKYFSLYPYNIASVSRREYSLDLKHTLQSSSSYVDYRQNHLSQCNHDILYSNIISLLEHEKTIDHKYEFLDELPKGDTYIYDQ